MELVVCEIDAKCISLLNDPSPFLKQLICIKPISSSTIELASKKGIKVWSLEEVEQLGATTAHKELVSFLSIKKKETNIISPRCYFWMLTNISFLAADA